MPPSTFKKALRPRPLTTCAGEGIFDASSLQWNSILETANLIAKYTNSSVIQGEKTGTSLIIPNKKLIPNFSSKISLDEGIQKTIELFKNEQI